MWTLPEACECAQLRSEYDYVLPGWWVIHACFFSSVFEVLFHWLLYRVPAFASGGLIPTVKRGTTVNTLLHIADWYATFCGRAGCNPVDTRAAMAGLPPIDSKVFAKQWVCTVVCKCLSVYDVISKSTYDLAILESSFNRKTEAVGKKERKKMLTLEVSDHCALGCVCFLARMRVSSGWMTIQD